MSIHPEAGPHLHRSLQTIKGLGKRAGVVLNPATPVSLVEPVIEDVDLILVILQILVELVDAACSRQVDATVIVRDVSDRKRARPKSVIHR